jgi:hypothetical protein
MRQLLTLWSDRLLRQDAPNDANFAEFGRRKCRVCEQARTVDGTQLQRPAKALTRRRPMNWRSGDGPPEPRLVFPRWRIARDATLSELTAAFIDRSRSENLSLATQRILPSNVRTMATLLRRTDPHGPSRRLT